MSSKIWPILISQSSLCIIWPYTNLWHMNVAIPPPARWFYLDFFSLENIPNKTSTLLSHFYCRYQYLSAPGWQVWRQGNHQGGTAEGNEHPKRQGWSMHMKLCFNALMTTLFTHLLILPVWSMPLGDLGISLKLIPQDMAIWKRRALLFKVRQLGSGYLETPSHLLDHGLSLLLTILFPVWILKQHTGC